MKVSTRSIPVRLDTLSIEEGGVRIELTTYGHSVKVVVDRKSGNEWTCVTDKQLTVEQLADRLAKP